MDGIQVSPAGEKRSATAFVPTSFFSIHSTRGQSFCLSRGPSVLGSWKLRYIMPQKRRREFDNGALGGLRMVESGRDSDVVTACTIINGIFEKAVEEMMFPLSADNSFASCRDLVANILLARSFGLNEEEMTQGLYNFEHKPELKSLPVLTELQRETVQAFIATVYNVDNALDLFGQERGASGFRGSSSVCRNCIRFDERFRRGIGLKELCKEQCQLTPWDLECEFNGTPVEVATRTTLPDRWTRIVTCIVIFLRKHLNFGIGSSLGGRS